MNSRNRFLITPDQYPKPNPRIDGFAKLKKVNARTVNIWVFAPEAFSSFKKNRVLPEQFIEEIKQKGKEILETATTRAAVVRRAYVVPGLENPPGPRFLGLKSITEIIAAIEEIFSFAIDQKYDTSPDSQISGFLYPFIDPPPIDKKNLDKCVLPYGGYAITASSDLSNIEIYAVFGNNEGVQSLVADRYKVSLDSRGRLIVTEKNVPQKPQMLCTTPENQSGLLALPPNIQFEQVLSEQEILEIARVVRDLDVSYGPQRVEFSSDEQGILFNEVANYWLQEAKIEQRYETTGKIITISSVDDLKKLQLIEPSQLSSGKQIVAISKEIVSERKYDILSALASWGSHLVVLYPGIAATQHAMRVLVDKGHRAFLVGTQQYQEGDEVKITSVGTKARVTNLSRTEQLELVSLWDASLFGNEICGGKANRLSQLKVAGFQVPHGSVITTKVFDSILELVTGSTGLVLSKFDEYNQQFINLPKQVSEKISKLLSEKTKSTGTFAVRSSATIEDATEESMAGMFSTSLNVPAKKIVDEAINIIKSVFSPHIETYLKGRPILANQLKMAVIIQDMVDAKCAGVIFGAGIHTRNDQIVEIEATRGIGEKVVAGTATTLEKIKYSRPDRRLIEKTGPSILTRVETQALFTLSERLRQQFHDVPQDIEWTIDKTGQIWILQSRDLSF